MPGVLFSLHCCVLYKSNYDFHNLTCPDTKFVFVVLMYKFSCSIYINIANGIKSYISSAIVSESQIMANSVLHSIILAAPVMFFRGPLTLNIQL